MGLFKKLLDLLYPPKCVFCGRITETSKVCDKCRKDLPYAPAGASSKGEFFSEYTAALKYEGKARESVLRFKFSDRSEYAEAYAPMLKEAAERDLPEFDIISWVPVSAKRLKKRGYDQAELLARETAKLMGREAARTLVKTVDNAPQYTLRGKEKRAANVMDVYKVADGADVKGKTVLLIDDIITTGATLSECARTLLMAGAEKIICAVLADAD